MVPLVNNMSDTEKDVQQVLAEAEAIRANGSASPQAGAAPQGGEGAAQAAPSPSPDWHQYMTEAGLCAMYADVALAKFGCSPLGHEERQQAAQAWAECLAKWFPSIKEFMGPELRLLTIYGLPVAGKVFQSWMSAPSPGLSADEEAARPRY